MTNPQSMVCFLLLLHITVEIFAMRCEDGYERNFHPWDRMPNDGLTMKDLLEMKEDIENLKQKSLESNVKDLPMFDIRYDAIPEKCRTQETPQNCGEATACIKRSGYYHLKLPQYSNESFLVECDAHTEGGDWTVIQRRQDGSVDFYRTWAEYRQGFGNIDGEFFIGMDKLHALTNYNGPQELLIIMVNDTTAGEKEAKYDDFAIGNEENKFVLKRIGRYTGTAGDSLTAHLAQPFSTKDQDNDKNVESSCAVAYLGAWWYTKCHSSNLNGHFGDASYGKGINWYSLSGHNRSLKYVKMMLRRRRTLIK
uniref:Fibrinogen C-terminal domain-containing protein n=1 Tax=Stomoxys calcitrans TaxID=35570 RepID=A0A1I8PYA9_STOCA